MTRDPSQPRRVLIIGGARRGKSTLGKMLSAELKLTHLCTDPQRLLSADMAGTPDHLDYSGDNGVGAWVAENWIGRDLTLIEGVKAIDALKRSLSSGHKSSHFFDKVIVLTERVDSFEGDDDKWSRQERQATHVMQVLEEIEDQLDNLELWYPVGDGKFARADY